MNKIASTLVAALMTLGAARAHESTAMVPSAEDRTRSPGHTTYYIDPAQGNDTASGLRQHQAWRTFTHINRLLLCPGDQVHITSPGSFDQTLMLTGAGTAEAPIEIHFAPGRYDFYPHRAVKRTYQISNTNGDPDTGKAIGILAHGAKHLNISGPGAIIFYRGKMIEVCIDGCQDIGISDLHFDYHRPTVSEFRVAAMGEGYVDLAIHTDSHYTLEDGKITWQGEGWSYDTGLAQALDLRTNEVWRRRDPLKGMTLEEIKPFLIRARGKHEMKPEYVYQIRDTKRDCAGVFTRRSRNVTWTNVQFQFLHGMGLVNQFSENLTFDRVTVASDANSGRTTAAWADCIQVSGCKGKVLVKDCVFSGAHDDAINIHGTHLRVVERLSDRQIKVRFMHAQTFGFMAFNPGDEIAFVRWDSLKPYGQNRIEHAEMLNPKDLLLTLEHPVPSTFKPNDAVENVTWTPEVEIRGCTVSRIPTRGFLITTRRKVVVENNEFQRTHMSAILLENDAKGWYESGGVRDMTIRKNRFIRCAEPVININPQNTVANDAVHQNIRVHDNEFVLRGTTAVRAKSTRALSITGNTLYSQRPLDDGVALRLTDCSDVTVKHNRYAQLLDQATVVIDTEAPSRAYSPMIFGGFLEHFGRQIYGGVFEPGSPLSDKKGFRLDVIAALKELKMPIIRWPGGCFVDAYHWQKGVGKERKPYGDFRWGVIESNEFGTDEFVEFCRLIGAEPYICHNGMASVQENVDWVSYCNATEGKFAEMRTKNGYPEPFNVKFWSVGNERYDKAYIHRVRDTAKAIKKLYPDVQMSCAGAQDGMKGVHSYLMEQAGECLDYVSIHSYALPRSHNHLPRYDYLTAITKSQGPEDFVDRVSKSLDAAGLGERIKVAYDEWNLRAWQHPGFPRSRVADYNDPKIVELVERRVKGNDLAEQYTMADALFAASFLNACLRHADHVTMANIAPLVNTRGPLFVHPKGIVKRTHFHTMAMYANELQARVAQLEVTAGTLTQGADSVAVVDAIATVDKLGKTWAIALANRHPSESVACTVRMNEDILDGTYRATALVGDSPDAYNDIEHPNRVVPEKMNVTFSQGVVSLPAHSLTIIEVASQEAISAISRRKENPK